MPDSLAVLEAERSKLLQEFLSLGDLRPGSVTAVIRRWGKPTCHCARPNDPGHDPQFRLTRGWRWVGEKIPLLYPSPCPLRRSCRRAFPRPHPLDRFPSPLLSSPRGLGSGLSRQVRGRSEAGFRPGPTGFPRRVEASRLTESFLCLPAPPVPPQVGGLLQASLWRP